MSGYLRDTTLVALDCQSALPSPPLPRGPREQAALPGFFLNQHPKGVPAFSLNFAFHPPRGFSPVTGQIPRPTPPFPRLSAALVFPC
jgi:hypothetical protein